jgi:phosphotransferase system HPr-like phosphotransfer protein
MTIDPDADDVPVDASHQKIVDIDHGLHVRPSTPIDQIASQLLDRHRVLG